MIHPALIAVGGKSGSGSALLGVNSGVRNRQTCGVLDGAGQLGASGLTQGVCGGQKRRSAVVVAYQMNKTLSCL